MQLLAAGFYVGVVEEKCFDQKTNDGYVVGMTDHSILKRQPK
jgi:hypothetical protein